MPTNPAGALESLESVITHASSPQKPSCRFQDQIYDILCAIIEQACTDYRNLVRLGYVVNGQLTEKGQGIIDTTSKAYMTSNEMLELIAFFYSPEFEHLCDDVLRIPIDPVAVRDRLGLP
ncbi:MAG: hypothetical protein V2A34_01995, partial [Lentisphaerota bacterium]